MADIQQPNQCCAARGKLPYRNQAFRHHPGKRRLNGAMGDLALGGFNPRGVGGKIGFCRKYS